jgi:hypothetical protein
MRFRKFLRQASKCGEGWCGRCQGHAATRSGPSRAVRATAPPHKPASISEGSSGCCMTISRSAGSSFLFASHDRATTRINGKEQWLASSGNACRTEHHLSLSGNTSTGRGRSTTKPPLCQECAKTGKHGPTILGQREHDRAAELGISGRDGTA